MSESTRDIVITEKSSQAKNVRAAVGNRYGRVMAAQGHLVELREPHEVDPDWKRWSCTVLAPAQGKLYGLKPSGDKRRGAILKDIRAALKNAPRVWLATDCDREGQLIGQEILEIARYRGDAMRVIFASEDPDTIAKAFENAKPNREYRSLYDAAVARQQGDQIYNLSLTRTATVALGGNTGVIGVGRVRSPTLAIVCRREREIERFRPSAYYHVEAIATTPRSDTFTMRHAPKTPITDAGEAAAIARAADGASVRAQVEAGERSEAPPALPNLARLQQTAAQSWGWTAVRTLEVAQSLYADHTLITYPRSDSRQLPEVAAGNAPRAMRALGALPGLDSITLPSEPVIRTGAKGTFNDAGLGEGGASHHAIVPNPNTLENLDQAVAALNTDERRLYDLIARSYLAALMPDHRYFETVITAQVGDIEFRASGRVETDRGWKDAIGTDADERKDKNPKLPPVSDGEILKMGPAQSVEKTTRAPSRYNEGTLIKAMIEAWRFVEQAEEREKLKATEGIGTSHTRGEVIAGLRRQAMLEEKGKHIVPSNAGMALFTLLERAAPELVDPGTSARLEARLEDIVNARAKSADAIAEITERTRGLVERIASHRGDSAMTRAVGAERAPTERMVALAKNIAARRGIAIPEDLESKSSVCRAFLDAHADAAAHAPTEKALAFAESVSERTGEAIPDNARTSAKALSDWIEARNATIPGRPPSERAIALAERIATETGKKLPDDARADTKKLSAWIDASKGAAPARPPSEKAIAFAQRIAGEKNVKLPAAAKKDAGALSKWIDSNK